MQIFCHRRKPGCKVSAEAEDQECSELAITQMHEQNEWNYW